MLHNVVLIPQKSTFEIQENIYVYKVKSDSSVEQQKVIPIAITAFVYN